MSDLPEGYRMSEVGVIPEEWEVMHILENSTLKARIGWQGLTTAEYLEQGAYYLITGTDFLDGKINWDRCNFVDEKRYVQDKNIQLKSEDVLITKDGTIGKIAYLDYLSGKATLNSGIFVIRPKKQEYLPLYFFYVLNSVYFNSFLEQLKAGSTISHLYQKDFISFKFLVPPLPEQQAIASALSDVDALITALEQLITKKRNIKQGAMQQLLTGKKRLPGFGGEWEVKKLGEIAEIATGNTPPTNDLNNYGNEFLFVSPADLGRSKYIIDSDKKLSKKGFNISRKFPKNSILFTCIGSTIGKSGIAPIVLTSNQQINAIFPNDSYSTDYVFYALNYMAYSIKSFASEQAVPIINKSTFEATQTPFPPLPEQQAIAQILSDMDTEIESLEQKQAKYKAIKQGMMQELLTGKRRLA